MLKVVLIRHGATPGNLERRYVGRTDEELCGVDYDEMRPSRYPDADVVFVSPMKRCRQTAERIYGTRMYIEVADFKEIDFGDFEMKNYKELSGDRRYQEWIDSNGKLPFPGGESTTLFKCRCIRAFEDICDYYGDTDKTVAIVAHGGTIMSILERFSGKPGSYYNWQVKTSGGYTAEFDAHSRILKNIAAL